MWDDVIAPSPEKSADVELSRSRGTGYSSSRGVRAATAAAILTIMVLVLYEDIMYYSLPYHTTAAVNYCCVVLSAAATTAVYCFLNVVYIWNAAGCETLKTKHICRIISILLYSVYSSTAVHIWLYRSIPPGMYTEYRFSPFLLLSLNPRAVDWRNSPLK